MVCCNVAGTLWGPPWRGGTQATLQHAVSLLLYSNKQHQHTHVRTHYRTSREIEANNYTACHPHLLVSRRRPWEGARNETSCGAGVLPPPVSSPRRPIPRRREKPCRPPQHPPQHQLRSRRSSYPRCFFVVFCFGGVKRFVSRFLRQQPTGDGSTGEERLVHARSATGGGGRKALAGPASAREEREEIEKAEILSPHHRRD